VARAAVLAAAALLAALHGGCARPGPGELVVEIHAVTEGMAGRGWYAPPELVVAPGTLVRWVNRDIRPHSVTSVAGLFDSGLILPGRDWTHRFDAAGEYPYDCYRCFCNPMGGRVIVRAGAAGLPGGRAAVARVPAAIDCPLPGHGAGAHGG
jgi:plastocyanin